MLLSHVKDKPADQSSQPTENKINPFASTKTNIFGSTNSKVDRTRFLKLFETVKNIGGLELESPISVTHLAVRPGLLPLDSKVIILNRHSIG